MKVKPTAVKLTAAAAGRAKALPVKVKATPTAGKTKAVAPPTKAARAVAKVTGSKKKPPVPALRKTLSKVRVKADSHRHARHDTDRTVLSCLVWRCELSRPDRQTGAFSLVRVGVYWAARSATAGRTPTQNALVRPSIDTATPDTTRPSRLPVDRRRRDAGQAGIYA